MKIFNQLYLASIKQLNNNNSNQNVDRNAGMTNPNRLSFSNQLTNDVAVFTSKINKMDKVAFTSNADPYYKNKMTLDDLPENLEGKTVLMRVDHSVKIKNGKVVGNQKIKETLGTIQELQRRNAKIIIVSHVGRPKDELKELQKSKPEANMKDLEKLNPEKLSIEPIAKELRKLLNKDNPEHTNVISMDNTGAPITAKTAQETIKTMKSKDILYLNNIRFDPREEDKNLAPELAKDLAGLADYYVNDAFATAHRKHASTYYVADEIRKKGGLAVAGKVMENEYTQLGTKFLNPKRPFVEITSGSKVNTKIPGIKQRLKSMEEGDCIILGGALPFTFLLAKEELKKEENSEYESNLKGVGISTVDEKSIPDAISVIKEAKKKKIDLLLPVDVVIVKGNLFSEDPKDAWIINGKEVLPEKVTKKMLIEEQNRLIDEEQKIKGRKLTEDEKEEFMLCKVVDVDKIPDGWQGVDIGPESTKMLKNKIKKANTFLWNGPLGVFEHGFIDSSREVYLTAGKIKENGGDSTLCGGDTNDLVDILEKEELAGVKRGLLSEDEAITQESFSHVSTAGGAASEFVGGDELPGIKCLNDRKSAPAPEAEVA